MGGFSGGFEVLRVSGELQLGRARERGRGVLCFVLRVSFSLVHCLLPFSFTFHLSFLPHFLPAFLPSCLFLPSSNLLPSLHLTFRLASLTFRFRFLCFLCFKQSMCSNLPPSTRFPAGELCDRPIIGIYDDHDWGWNDGNSRLPDKDAYKRRLQAPLSRRSRGGGRQSQEEGLQRSVREVLVQVRERSESESRRSLFARRALRSLSSSLPRAKGLVHERSSSVPGPQQVGVVQRLRKRRQLLLSGRGDCSSIALKFCLDPSNAAYKDPLFEQACDARHELWGTQPIKVDRTVAPQALSTDVTFGDRRWNYGFCDVLGEPAKRKCDHK